MNLFVSLIGVFLGLILFFGVVILVIYLKMKKVVGPINLNQLRNTVENQTNLKRQEYTRIKSISGITKLIEPTIIKDFPEFNKELLYKQVENNLLEIFESIQNKSIKNIEKDNDLILIKEEIIKKINNLKLLDVNIKYENVKFHNHVIKDYRKNGDIATITICSLLEYYYKCEGKDKYKIIKGDYFEDLKKQTRYITKFVYIYDETKLNGNDTVFTTNCPNCGAPVIKAGICEYCHSKLEEINLKLWKMSFYKEDI